MSTPALGATAASLRQWRVATAVRVFALALVVGGTLAEGTTTRTAPVLTVLILLALVAILLEIGPPTELTRWLPVGEGLIVTIVLMLTNAPLSTMVYLATPAIVAGLRYGAVTAINTACVSIAAAVGVVVSTQASLVDSLPSAITWQLAGLGVGVLAARLLRDVRRQEASQAPYAEAHRHLAQLFGLTQRGRVGLDSTRLATELVTELGEATRFDACGVVVHRDGVVVETLAHSGDAEALMASWQQGVADASRPALLTVALTEDGAPLGCTAVLLREGGWSAEDSQRVLQTAMSRALPLSTALLFNELRLIGVAEERDRIARDIHDGVAQELVGLGFIVDEIQQVGQGAAAELATTLRAELTRVVGELRFSIFDLRNRPRDQRVSEALAEYAREAGRGHDLNVHLDLHESTPAMPRATADELLKIAQEAITNVRRHAQAQNLWIRLTWDGSHLDFAVEDDGVGDAAPRARHWGIQSMNERATNIGALFCLAARPGRGTAITVRTSPHHEGLAS